MSLAKLKRTLAGLPAVVVLFSISPMLPPQRAQGGEVTAVAAAIDRAVDKRLAEARIPASPQADAAEFLRRVSLDIIGRIPTLERAVAFLESKDPDKRSRLIDDLLASREYAQHFATLWRNRIAPPNPVNPAKGKGGTDRFGPWLAEQFQRNRGWDQIVTDLVTAEGDIQKVPQTSFLMANSENFRPQPNMVAAATTRLFLGVRLSCAECHDHPFASWRQADFWGTAAFFSRLRNSSRKGPPFILTEQTDPNPMPPAQGEPARIQQAPGGAIVIPEVAGKSAGKVVKARFLGGKEFELAEGPMRPTFAAWLTSAENPFFAPAYVNRLWGQLLGRGFVNPVDDFRDDTPPSHPDLLKLLAGEFRASGYDCQHLIRCICNSKTYQRTSRPLPGNESDRELFSRMAVKTLSPEAFCDSLAALQAVNKSGVPVGKPNAGKESIPTLEGREELVAFFRSQGETTDEAGVNLGIPQFLRRLNGEAFNRGTPLIDRLVRTGASPQQAIESLYLAVLTRRPTAEEAALMSAYLSRRPSPAEGYSGVLWILLNSGEFVLNH